MVNEEIKLAKQCEAKHCKAKQSPKNQTSRTGWFSGLGLKGLQVHIKDRMCARSKIRAK